MSSRYVSISETEYINLAACLIDFAKFKEVIGQITEASELHKTHRELCKAWDAGRKRKMVKVSF